MMRYHVFFSFNVSDKFDDFRRIETFPSYIIVITTNNSVRLLRKILRGQCRAP